MAKSKKNKKKKKRSSKRKEDEEVPDAAVVDRNKSSEATTVESKIATQILGETKSNIGKEDCGKAKKKSKKKKKKKEKRQENTDAAAVQEPKEQQTKTNKKKAAASSDAQPKQQQQQQQQQADSPKKKSPYFSSSNDNKEETVINERDNVTKRNKRKRKRKRSNSGTSNSSSVVQTTSGETSTIPINQQEPRSRKSIANEAIAATTKSKSISSPLSSNKVNDQTKKKSDSEQIKRKKVMEKNDNSKSLETTNTSPSKGDIKKKKHRNKDNNDKRLLKLPPPNNSSRDKKDKSSSSSSSAAPAVVRSRKQNKQNENSNSKASSSSSSSVSSSSVSSSSVSSSSVSSSSSSASDKLQKDLKGISRPKDTKIGATAKLSLKRSSSLSSSSSSSVSSSSVSSSSVSSVSSSTTSSSESPPAQHNNTKIEAAAATAKLTKNENKNQQQRQEQTDADNVIHENIPRTIPIVVQNDDESANAKTQPLTAKQQRKRRRPTLYNDNDSKIYGDEDSNDEGSKEKQKKRKHGGNVSLEALKHSILGRKLQTNPNGTIEEELEALKVQHEQQQQQAASGGLPTKVLDSLRRELACPICYEVLVDPVSLLCGHSFCRDCLQWWIDASSKGSMTESSSPEAGTKCPTCRSIFDSFHVNFHLRACVTTLFPKVIEERLRAKLARQAGENSGRHSRGYEIATSLESADEEPIRLNSKNKSSGNGSDSNFILRKVTLRRSIVVDANDQRMRLAMALYGSIETVALPKAAVAASNGGGGNAKFAMKVRICLVELEEDEASEGIPKQLGKGVAFNGHGDDEAFLVGDSRFANTFLSLSKQRPNGVSNNNNNAKENWDPLSRRQFSDEEMVEVTIPLPSIGSSNNNSASFLMHHEETGLKLILQVMGSMKEDSKSIKDSQECSSEEDYESAKESIDEDDDASSKDNEFVHGVSGSGEREDSYEYDDFVVPDSDDDNGSSSNSSACDFDDVGTESSRSPPSALKRRRVIEESDDDGSEVE